MELANVPAGRPERNRIPSKIGEHCKKLLKAKHGWDLHKCFNIQWNLQFVAIVTWRAKVVIGRRLLQPPIGKPPWRQRRPRRQRERMTHRKAMPSIAPTGPSPRRA